MCPGRGIPHLGRGRLPHPGNPAHRGGLEFQERMQFAGGSQTDATKRTLDAREENTPTIENTRMAPFQRGSFRGTGHAGQ
eukprot:6118031-Heterocapsa_arctica.AAC.1